MDTRGGPWKLITNFDLRTPRLLPLASPYPLISLEESNQALHTDVNLMVQTTFIREKEPEERESRAGDTTY